jgi:3-phenylpropionate/trans-cinnamate dioxygenase ferredoxin subunit
MVDGDVLMGWHSSIKAGELGEGEVCGITIGDTQIALYKIDGAIFATSNICTHEYALLSDGYLDGDCVECPLHAAVFHVPTGEVRDGPTSCALKTFPVKLQDDMVMVEIA